MSNKDKIIVNDSEGDFSFRQKNYLRVFWNIIDNKNRFALIKILYLAVFASILEAIILLLVPLIISYSTGNVKLIEYYNLKNQFFLQIIKNEYLFILFSIFLISLTGFVKVFLLKKQTVVSQGVGSFLSSSIFKLLLNSNYEYVKNIESSLLISSLTVQINKIVYDFIIPITFFVSSAIIAIATCLALLFIIPSSGIFIISLISIIYLFTIYFVRKTISNSGKQISDAQELTVQQAQNAIGGLRDIIIYNENEFRLQQFLNLQIKLRSAMARIQYLGGAPRHLIETVGLLALVALVMISARFNVVENLPSLVALAVGLQRLLPQAQTMFNSWSQMKGTEPTIQQVGELCGALREIQNAPVTVENSRPMFPPLALVLDNVGYRYKGSSKALLNGVSATIQSMQSVLISGPSGHGKSTLMDILLGLRPASEGAVWINNTRLGPDTREGWWNLVAHVSQSIYIESGSVEQVMSQYLTDTSQSSDLINLAMATTELDSELLIGRRASSVLVGENAASISGGQRQRLALARALVRNRPVLVLDEAMSALDEASEFRILHNIRNNYPKITIISISHRISTRKFYDIHLEIADGDFSVKK